MRLHPPPLLEKCRMHFEDPELDGYNSDPGELHGAFKIEGPVGTVLRVISSGVDFEFNWEHVSVSCERRTPIWEEMCFVKDLFWADTEVVMQLHPSRDQYVNHHPNCLHLWKPMKGQIPLPPPGLVGPQ